jgi:hypothetical protein
MARLLVEAAHGHVFASGLSPELKVRALAAFIGRSPDTATAEDLRLLQLHQTQIGLQPLSINSAVSALCFFFTVTLDRPDLARRLTVVPQPRRIPAVLSVEEVTLPTGITAYLEAGGSLENAEAMAAHESPRTTKLYDRTGDEITLDEVERISI